MKFIYSKFFIYSVFFLAFFSLYFVAINLTGSSNKTLRILEESEDGLEKICKENEDIYNYYYKTENYTVLEEDFGKMNDASQIILDILTEGFEAKYIFDYLAYVGKYIFFLILLILIIILTIYYSIASCIRCCTEKCCDFFSFEFCKIKPFKKTICILIPFIYLIVFIFAIVSIAFVVAAIKKFSATICVGLQLVDTLIEGDIRKVHPRWEGINVVSHVLEELGNLTSVNNQQLVKDINDNKINYMNKWEEWLNYLNQSDIKNTGKNFKIDSPKMTLTDEEKEITLTPFYSYYWGPLNNNESVLYDILYSDFASSSQIANIIDVFEKYLYGFLGCDVLENGNISCVEESTVSEVLNSASNIIRRIEEPISNIKEKITTPVQNIYDSVNSTVVGIFSVVIIFVIIYCILIECLLSVFCCTKKCKCVGCCLKWILCFIYYTSIIIIIVGFILGIIVGVIGSIVQNMTKVVEYITSQENLLADDPKIFGQNGYTKYLDVCLNGNGDLAAALGLIDSFDSIDNITEISDETEDIQQKTNKTSPVINYYKEFLGNLSTNYLNFPYYNIEGQDVKEFNINERISEINRYVSGEYAENKQDTCSINETWSTSKTNSIYTYNENYPTPDSTTRYLIYLYDNNLYNNVSFDSRYNNACPTGGHPYQTVSEASSKFSNLFKDIRDNILSDTFSKSYTEDLNELNRIYAEKNEYLIKALEYALDPIVRIEQTYKKYESGKDNIFSLLNCKFVGDNKLILMDVLYTSLGYYLDVFGTCTSLMSLFIFVGIVCILIVIKNTKLDTKEGASDVDLETLNDILTGNDTIEKDTSNNQQTQELLSYSN